jgi:hypothetical protein
MPLKPMLPRIFCFLKVITAPGFTGKRYAQYLATVQTQTVVQEINFDK